MVQTEETDKMRELLSFAKEHFPTYHRVNVYVGGGGWGRRGGREEGKGDGFHNSTNGEKEKKNRIKCASRDFFFLCTEMQINTLHLPLHLQESV